ncbi:pyridoxine 5'-phosphate oxidase C-terminal domain-containing protein [Microbacterium sp.]|uniref:pyridoxine 5'-phosphate oxidase C-terminal domain-containing protein n=1 Tax=Microbacterium sp. TaxID=51671 RepID=UPI003A86729E
MPYLQQLAWVNTQAYADQSRDTRVAEWARFSASHPDPTAPETWVGFAVEPRRMLFWEGAEDAASRRAEYVRDAGRWLHRVLPG